MKKSNMMKYISIFILFTIFCIYLVTPFITYTQYHSPFKMNSTGIESMSALYKSFGFKNSLHQLLTNNIILCRWLKAVVFLYFLLFIIVFIAGYLSKQNGEGPKTLPQEGTHGTARWMTNEEANKIFKLKSGPVDGLIFGKVSSDKNIAFKRNAGFKRVTLELPAGSNKNVAVYGAAGTGKSRAFVRNQILQIAKMEQSMVITDPKAELFEDMAGFLKDQGYNVKVLNLVHMIHSDRWNPLAEVTDDISAQSFVETVMANTRPVGAKVDEFWEKSEMNLLKALVLYVVTISPEEDKNLATVYSMLATKDVVTLDGMFAQLDYSNPAKMPYEIYSQAGDKVKPGIIIGLGSKLQIFQNEIVQNLTAQSDIDLTEPKYKKTAYFCIVSDSESTFDFVAGLFFSFLFIKLTKYADFYKDIIPIKDQQEVYFILDEFPNIGAIPDFTKKISTLRSRGIICFVIFQNIAQLQNRYPNNGWLEILGNCDSQLFLGASDDMTAKQVSEHMGVTTVETHSANKKAGIGGLTDLGSQNTSSSKRNLLNPDELLKLDKSKAILMERGHQPLMIYKMDYSEHELANSIKPIGVRNYKLPWAESYYEEEERQIRLIKESSAKLHKKDKRNKNELVTKDMVLKFLKNNLIDKVSSTLSHKLKPNIHNKKNNIEEVKSDTICKPIDIKAHIPNDNIEFNTNQKPPTNIDTSMKKLDSIINNSLHDIPQDEKEQINSSNQNSDNTELKETKKNSCKKKDKNIPGQQNFLNGDDENTFW